MGHTKTTTYSDFRNNLKAYLDLATEDNEPVIITRKRKQSAVLISEATYNNLIENQFVLGNPTNLRWLTESANELKTGKVRAHELVNPEKRND